MTNTRTAHILYMPNKATRVGRYHHRLRDDASQLSVVVLWDSNTNSCMYSIVLFLVPSAAGEVTDPQAPMGRERAKGRHVKTVVGHARRMHCWVCGILTLLHKLFSRQGRTSHVLVFHPYDIPIAHILGPHPGQLLLQ